MIDYQKEQEHYLQKVWFDYNGARYLGRGILRWHPINGFHFDAFVECSKSTPLKVKKYIIGGQTIIGPEDRTSIKATLHTGHWLVIPRCDMSIPLELISENRLSLHPNRVIFGNKCKDNAKKRMHASAFFDCNYNILMPDTVETEVRINDTTILYKRDMGIKYGDNDMQLTFRKVSDNILEADLDYTNTDVNKYYLWSWMEAFYRALSLLCGHTVVLRQNRVNCINHEYVDMRSGYEPIKLQNHLCLFNEDIIDREILIKLTAFFASRNSHANLCYKAFLQMVDASRQFSHRGTELLCSITLEALLRSINNEPFSADTRGRNSWNVEHSLRLFRDRYLTIEWRSTCKKVVKAYKRLRHINAHPDWISTDRLSSKDEFKQSIDDMTLLSRFYGYMILAMAGFRDIEPNF